MVLIKESYAEVIYFIFKWPDFPSLLSWRLNLEQFGGGHEVLSEKGKWKGMHLIKKNTDICLSYFWVLMAHIKIHWK